MQICSEKFPLLIIWPCRVGHDIYVTYCLPYKMFSWVFPRILNCAYLWLSSFFFCANNYNLVQNGRFPIWSHYDTMYKIVHKYTRPLFLQELGLFLWLGITYYYKWCEMFLYWADKVQTSTKDSLEFLMRSIVAQDTKLYTTWFKYLKG